MLLAVLDNWEATELTGLARKADPHGPHAKTGGDAALARRHLLDLAAGRGAPGARTEKVKTPSKAPLRAKEPKSTIGAVQQSKVHSGAARPSRARKSS